MSRFIKEMPSALIDTGKAEKAVFLKMFLWEKRAYSSEVSGYRSAYAQTSIAAIQKERTDGEKVGGTLTESEIVYGM